MSKPQVHSFEEAKSINHWLGFSNISLVREFYKYLGMEIPSIFTNNYAKKNPLFCVHIKLDDYVIIEKQEYLDNYTGVITLFTERYALASIYD